jgi:hypothetical protein
MKSTNRLQVSLLIALPFFFWNSIHASKWSLVNSGGFVVDGEFGGSVGGIRDNADGLDSSAGGMYRVHRSNAGRQL